MSRNSPSSKPAALSHLEATDAVFSALAHPARRQILMYLQVLGGRLPAGQIADRFACSWPTITRHLQVLTQAGLVRVERSGRSRTYVLERDYLARIAGDWLRWFSG